MYHIKKIKTPMLVSVFKSFYQPPALYCFKRIIKQLKYFIQTVKNKTQNKHRITLQVCTTHIFNFHKTRLSCTNGIIKCVTCFSSNAYALFASIPMLWHRIKKYCALFGVSATDACFSYAFTRRYHKEIS